MSDREAELLIVGAGPQGLAVAAYTRRYQNITAVVIDPAGWLGNWDDQFARLDIRELDSPLGAHPNPDHYALARYVGREPEALHNPSVRASTTAFHDFCHQTAEEYGLTVLHRRVVAVDTTDAAVRVTCDDGTELRARQIVLATNPTTPVIPDWAQQFAGSSAPITHTRDLDLRRMSVASKAMLVVGGGLTGVQVALRLRERGAAVTLVSRSRLRSHEELEFDSTWRDSWESEAFQQTESLEQRLVIARNGHQPSAPEATLDRLERDGVRIGEEVQVIAATWDGNEFVVALSNGRTLPFDGIIEATGVRPDMQGDPMTRTLLQQAHPRFVNGYPVLAEDLTIPGTRVAVVGASAALQLGPWAYYIFGARMAAERLQPPGAPRAYLDPRPQYQATGQSL